ncbi:c-type cytochrome [Salinisphaera aquimarina]|uniref:C-type cytochrome n=1 Tax=Salinisphaera aquimarina TaxID=2094031 RepID=A0ABV7EUA4_9GAMM
MSRTIALTLVFGLTISSVALAEQADYGLGRPASDAEIAGWNIDVRPSGAGLPEGSGTAGDGEAIYKTQCAACHGPKGENGAFPRLVGGQGTLASDKPIKTVGSYWPYATTLYDYIHRAMPLTSPQSLSPDETYAVTAYVLYLNGLVDRDEALDAGTLAKVEMPNRNGFVSPDPRPDVSNEACMQDCVQNSELKAK